MNKRKICLIVFWLTITICQAQMQDAIRINESDVKISRGQVYDRIAWNSDYTTDEVGKPELPYYRVSYVLPVPNGIYLLRVKTKNKEIVRKIINKYKMIISMEEGKPMLPVQILKYIIT